MSKDKADALPTGWAVATLGEIGTWRGGSTPSKRNPNFWVDADYPWVTPKDMKVGAISDSEDHLSEKALSEANINLIPSRSVLLVTRSGILSRLLPVAVTGQPVTINQDLKAITPHRGLDAEFIGWFFRFAANPILQSCSKPGTTVASINTEELKAVDIPIPPWNEQRRIVAKIEELFSELDNGVESLKATRAQIKTYRQSLLKAAFEGRLTEQWRRDNADSLETADQLLHRIREERKARYQQQLQEWKPAVANWEADGKPGPKPRKPNAPKTVTEEPERPEGVLPAYWRMVRIADVGDVGTGVTPLKKRADFYEGGTVPWVTSGAVNEPFVRQPSGYVTETALKETNLRLYPEGTLLVAMYGEGKTRGKASELAIDATTNQALAAISCHGGRTGIQPYLKWFLIHNYEEIRRYSSGGVQPNLNLGIVENTAFPLCSYEEQGEIVNRLEVAFSRIREMEQTIESTLRRSEALRQSILKRAFEGKLVPQDPDDEPASVLLERIRAEQNKEPKSAKGRRKANV